MTETSRTYEDYCDRVRESAFDDLATLGYISKGISLRLSGIGEDPDDLVEFFDETSDPNTKFVASENIDPNCAGCANVLSDFCEFCVDREHFKEE